MPYGEDSPVDLLIEKGGVFKRVQVKSTVPINGAVVCRLKSSNNWQVKKYTRAEIDFFAIYDLKNKKGYLLPIEEFEGRTEVYLRITDAKNNQKEGIRIAEKYIYF
ncbi:Uncharacterised protein [uncultured archaeon]|nr:Uncharacterised protein [uncultured archaeon]